MIKTLGQIAYEGAAIATGCAQPWEEANKEKWEVAARAVAAECCKAIDNIDDGKAPEYRACQEAITDRVQL